MKSSIKFGSVRGIDMFVHWTFLVMLVGIFIFYVYQGLTIVGALMGVGLILAVFGCVVLHELGHAFMAREFGIPTLDITMYPIGGVARLQRMPRPRPQGLTLLFHACSLSNLAATDGVVRPNDPTSRLLLVRALARAERRKAPAL